MNRARMLLRVSSDQQLDADGDLNVQRKIVQEYVAKNKDWCLDSVEYFEGGVSAYKNTSTDRAVLQQILQDARNGEFNILVLYKDDRVGRLMWDTSMYIMELKRYNIDVYTVKDGRITPENDDIMGQMMLTFRYANAQKSSADTGMRVKDTAQKLVEQGKFMGGKAPFGYRLEYSGEISKHGRALKHLVIVSEEAEVVKHIFELSLTKEYGSQKIARLLNEDEQYKNMAPKDYWKTGTITSILTNPVYAGRVAYKRRERKNGSYHRLDKRDWIYSEHRDESIAIISEEIWNRAQEKRKNRCAKYTLRLENKNVTVIKRNDGSLPLVDVIHCGYCGGNLTNGSKYNYWVIKGTGERRASKSGIYKCINAYNGIPHNDVHFFMAKDIEPPIFEAISEYIGGLQKNENIFDEIEKNHNRERVKKEAEIKKDKLGLKKISSNIEVMESKIPLAIQGDYPLSLEELVVLIRKQKVELERQETLIQEKEAELRSSVVSFEDWDSIRKNIPTWKDVFLNADAATKRVLVNKLIERIDVKTDEVVVKFRINLEDFSSYTTEKEINQKLVGFPGYRSMRLNDLDIKIGN